MKMTFFFMVSMWVAMQSGAQSLLLPAVQTSQALTAYSRQQTSVFSWHTQAAALAACKKINAGIAGERRYGLKDWQGLELTMSSHTEFGVWGFHSSLQHIGVWSVMRHEFGFGRRLGKKADLGAGFSWQRTGIKGYEPASYWSARAGVIFHPTEQLHTGISLDNPAGGKHGRNGWVYLPMRWIWGCGYDASPRFFTGFELVKTKDEPVEIRAGFSYLPVNRLKITAGVSTSSSSVSAGVSFRINKWWIDLQTAIHPQLGLTPSMAFIFDPGPK